MIDLDLTGRKAIVTGASLGIGAATVRLLADHGASVAFCARGQDAVDDLASHSDTIRGYVADMSDADSTNRFLQRATDDLGDADILVNNVGASPSRNFLYMDDADWEQLFQLNMMSAVRCTRHVLPHMRAQHWGRVVMISTVGALYPSAALIDYAATKSAMISTAKALAGKYGRDGVLVNSILPGLIHTAMWDRAAARARRVDRQVTRRGHGQQLQRRACRAGMAPPKKSQMRSCSFAPTLPPTSMDKPSASMADLRVTSKCCFSSSRICSSDVGASG